MLINNPPVTNNAEQALPSHENIMEKMMDMFMPATTTSFQAPARSSVVSKGKGTETLFSGQTVDDLPPNLSSAIQKAYKNHPEIPPGQLEMMTQQESSMGTNSSKQNPRNGKYGWMFGLVKAPQGQTDEAGALDYLDQKKIPYNTGTVEGAAEAAAAYYSFKRNEYDDQGNVAQTFDRGSQAYMRYAPQVAKDPTVGFDQDRYDSGVEFYANASQKGNDIATK